MADGPDPRAQFTKEEILTYYFNTVDFGQNSFGLKTAARTFFNKAPDSLNIQEGAVLVGLQKATTSYNPLKNPKNSLTRRKLCWGKWAKYKYLTKAQVDSISDLPLKTDHTPKTPMPASQLPQERGGRFCDGVGRS
jgi:penicillin-binding protein 1A